MIDPYPSPTFAASLSLSTCMIRRNITSCNLFLLTLFVLTSLRQKAESPGVVSHPESHAHEALNITYSEPISYPSQLLRFILEGSLWNTQPVLGTFLYISTYSLPVPCMFFLQLKSSPPMTISTPLEFCQIVVVSNTCCVL